MLKVTKDEISAAAADTDSLLRDIEAAGIATVPEMHPGAPAPAPSDPPEDGAGATPPRPVFLRSMLLYVAKAHQRSGAFSAHPRTFGGLIHLRSLFGPFGRPLTPCVARVR